MVCVKTVKVWMIEDDLDWYGLPIVRFEPGQWVITNKRYTGDMGEDKAPLVGTITGYELRDEDSPNELIGVQYTHREIYTVTFDDGRKSVLWPEESDLLVDFSVAK